MNAARLALVVCVAWCGACARDTTGVFLTIDGSDIGLDQLRVTAVSSHATVARLLPRPGAMPVTMIAELPAVPDTVVFEVEALLNGSPLVAAQSSPITIRPNELVNGSVRLVWTNSAGPLDGSMGSLTPPDAGLDAGSGSGAQTAPDAGTVKPPPQLPPPPLYEMAVLTDTPVAYYRLGEATGALAADSSGHRLVASYGDKVLHHVPSPLGAAEPIADGAAGFTGLAPPAGVVARAVNTPPSSTLLQPTSALSVELWLKHPADDPNEEVLLSYDSQSQFYPAYVVSLIGETLKFTIKTDTASVNDSLLSSRTPLVANTTYHVVVTYDGSAMSLYLDGVLDARTAVGGHLVYGDATSGLGIGGTFTPLGRPSFIGVLDEVALYDVPLQAPRIMEHYRLGAGL